MHPAISTSYVIPAIFLTPVLFLHTVNTLLSRLLPPIVVATATVQRPSYSMFGPAATHPHIDIHSSEPLCWSYTIVMICAQLFAYDRVMKVREVDKERQRRRDAKNGIDRQSKHSESYWEEGNTGTDGKDTFTNGCLKENKKHDDSDSTTEEDSEFIP